MSKKRNSYFIGLISNSVLFLSSFLLLINFAPRDLFPSYRKSVKAIQTLKEAQNILGNLPKHINVNPGSKSIKISSDPDAFAIITQFIKERSPLSSNVNWQQAVGVGYSTVNIPVWKNTIDAFHPLYIVTMPTENLDTFNLEPVGQLSDLETWLKESHLSSLNKTAIVLLAFGFLLQLVEKISEWRSIT
jgi:hypothetical protein